MPLEPRPKPESGRPAAERQFVDREEPIAIFQAALSRPQPTKPLVLVFHGGAGTGKSRLRRELMRLVNGGAPEPPNPGTREPPLRVVAATLDFDLPVHRQPDAALFSLRKAIGEACKAGFPSFDLALAVLWQKTHPDTPMGLARLSAEENRACTHARSQNGGCTQQETVTPPCEELRTLLEPGSLLSQLLDEAGKLPLIGLIPRVSALVDSRQQTVDRAGPTSNLPPSTYYLDWWRERGERELEDLPQMEPAAIVEQLPKLWASDLKDFLKPESRES